jgi:hypothetical protein
MENSISHTSREADEFQETEAINKSTLKETIDAVFMATTSAV